MRLDLRQRGSALSLQVLGAADDLPAVLDKSLASGVIRVPAATEASAQLGAMFGAVSVEKVESSALAATV